MKLLNNLLWTLPFLCFALGYQVLNQLYPTQVIATPNLVGLNLASALKITSNLKLNLRIISQQVDQDLPEDTILSQKPTHPFIKTSQTLLIVVSQKPAAKITPNLCGLSKPEIATKLGTQNLNFKSYQLPNLAASTTCFAQYPVAGKDLKNEPIVTYFGNQDLNLVIMPTLTGLSLSDVKNLLTTYDLRLIIRYLEPHSACQDYPKNTIIEQKPIAGTIINLTQLKQVELGLFARMEAGL